MEAVPTTADTGLADAPSPADLGSADPVADIGAKPTDDASNPMTDSAVNKKTNVTRVVIMRCVRMVYSVVIVMLFIMAVWLVLDRCGAENFTPPWFKDRPKSPRNYDFTTRLDTEHIWKRPRELCRAYTQDVYSRPHDCV